MARYKLLITPSAVREIKAIPRKKVRRRITERIRDLADDPRPPGCQKLSGRDRYRLRQGLYRIVYGIQDRSLIVCTITSSFL